MILPGRAFRGGDDKDDNDDSCGQFEMSSMYHDYMTLLGQASKGDDGDDSHGHFEKSSMIPCSSVETMMISGPRQQLHHL